MGKGIPYRNSEGFPDPTPWRAVNNMMEQDKYKRMTRGLQAKRSGQIFEMQIDRALEYYKDRGMAIVKKTPEPMKPIRPAGTRGQFVACFTKPAQVDYSGTLKGGRAIRFEAKQTDTDRFERDRLTPEQMADLEEHEKLGAYCCVMICFGLDNVYRIPWDMWRDMKQHFGRLYIKEGDSLLDECIVQKDIGTFLILEDIEA